MKNRFFHLTLVCLILSLPFERLLTLDAFGFTLKISYFFGVLLIASILPAFIKARKFDFIDKAGILFVLFSFISMLWSIDLKRTFIISLLYLFVFTLMYVIKRYSDAKKQEAYLNIFLGIGVILSIFALWQFFSNSFNILDNFSFLRDEYKKGVFPFPRVQATFLEPLFFANFLIIPFFISLKKTLQKSEKFGFISLFLISIALTLTLSRGAYYSLAFSLFLFCLGFIFVLKNKISKIMPAIFTIIAAIVCSIILIFASTGQSGLRSYVNQAKNTTDVQDANSVSKLDYLRTRNYTMQVAITHIKQNLIGIGTGAFGSLPEFQALKDKGSHQTVNNEYLEVLVENGLVGFVLFSLFIILLVVELYRRAILSKNLSSLAFLVTVIALLTQYLTFSNLYLIYIWVFFGLILAQKNKETA